jgi:DNA-binding CsgD family transcriptional regulator
VVHGLTTILLERAERTPLLIGIDDAHFLDLASLRCLLHLARRVDRARVLVVVNEATSVRQRWPMLWAELLSLPHCGQVRLGPLSPGGVADVVAAQADLPAACQPSMCDEITGGNPLLLHALIEDYRNAGRKLPNQFTGTAFGQAVLTWLYRSDPVLLPLACALAMFDYPVDSRLLDELLDSDRASNTWAVNAATEAGLLEGGKFRHEQARAAVLAAMDPQERAELHRRVAAVLYRRSAPAVAIARHQIAAQHTDAVWSTSVLHEAAQQALDEDNVALALDCLRLAELGCGGEAERASVLSTIMRVTWRTDPAAAERQIWDLLVAVRSGQLANRAGVELVDYLAWYGRPSQAGEVLDHLSRSVAATDNDLAFALQSVGARLAYSFPGFFASDAAGRAASQPAGLATTAEKLQVRAAGMIGAVLADGFSEDALEDARSILEFSLPAEDTWEPVMISLQVMALAECLHEAALWCDAQLHQAMQRQVPTWSAHLSAIRAMISFRQGRLSEADRYARAALSHVPPKGLGVFIGIPLSIVLLTSTRVGAYEQALAYLRMPVPEAMLQTPFGLHYVRARGRYYLARRNYKAAAEDFEACGELMIKWGLDLPGIVPWRTDLAEVNLALGAPARSLALDQLDRLGPHNGRTRGISLRMLAAASELKERLPILYRAVDVLDSSGDQLELADALTELSNVQRSLGEHEEAATTARRAHQVALQSKLETLPRTLSPDMSQQAAPAQCLEGKPAMLELSDAERRVASLAAQGHSNRQIARQLYITISTVEQHLTRVYRKLQVNRRTDLPFVFVSELDKST